MFARNFHLRNLDPLNDVADFLGIASLRDISHAQLALDFDLNAEGSTIQRFDFDTDDISLRARCHVNNDRWLDGTIALSLPRRTLEESKIFKTLLSIARERNNQLDFVVHTTGFLGSIRTELTESDFRDKLKERVSTRIQQHIENEIKKAIEGN